MKNRKDIDDSVVMFNMAKTVNHREIFVRTIQLKYLSLCKAIYRALPMKAKNTVYFSIFLLELYIGFKEMCIVPLK